MCHTSTIHARNEVAPALLEDTDTHATTMAQVLTLSVPGRLKDGEICNGIEAKT